MARIAARLTATDWVGPELASAITTTSLPDRAPAASERPGGYRPCETSFIGVVVRVVWIAAAMRWCLFYFSSERTGAAVTPQPSHEVVRNSPREVPPDM